MTKKQFIGYVKDFRITKGKAMYENNKSSRMRLRFSLLWAAVKNVFTGKGLYLSGQISASIGSPGITLETWIKKDCKDSDWEHWTCSFDGTPAKGYINGTEIKND